YLLGDPGATGVVVENADLAERVFAVEDELDLSFVVVMDDPGEYGDREDVHTLAEVHDRGRDVFDPEAYESWLDERDVEDLASLIYTSGTTGQPKGAKLTHWNFRSNVNQIRKRVAPRPERPEGVPSIGADARSVSYLPLAHVFERTAGHFVMFASGATVAYAETPDTLQEDFNLVEPNTATSVPRVYEKIYEAIREQASESALKKRIFEWATDVGQAYHESDSPGLGLSAKQAVADRLVFETVRENLGGNLEMLISGGGSLSAELCSLYHAMGLPIFEGYGLTETAPVLTVNPPEDPKVGTIGPALPDVDLHVDTTVVPQEKYDDVDGETGELLARGPNVFGGYWNNPEATETAFSEFEGEEWFRTGDVVTVRPDGYLVFRERAKQIAVLSTGKNVAPGPIEDAFAASDLVEQVLVVADARKFVSAVVVPNDDGVRRWADRQGIDVPDDPEAIVEDDRVRERIADVVEEVNQGFEKHERIKKFVLVPQEFTEDNDMLTPTMKKKRRNILEQFEEEIESMYEETGVDA
ncbi:MAG: long-chain fatty acid--CoA ligase, partial [Halobacteriales archaeon]